MDFYKIKYLVFDTEICEVTNHSILYFSRTAAVRSDLETATRIVLNCVNVRIILWWNFTETSADWVAHLLTEQVSGIWSQQTQTEHKNCQGNALQSSHPRRVLMSGLNRTSASAFRTAVCYKMLNISSPLMSCGAQLHLYFMYKYIPEGYLWEAGK